MVLNHTSDQHPWFQEARSSRDNPKRDWYVWSDTDSVTRRADYFPRYRNVQLVVGSGIEVVLLAQIFSHQPDLNYDNPAVFEAMWGVMKFWLDIGVDGFRLDAVPYLVEREGTNCENLPETHAMIRELR